jgi:hypothetical protein
LRGDLEPGTTIESKWSSVVYPAGLLPISSSDVYTYSHIPWSSCSIRATEYARLVAQGKYNPGLSGRDGDTFFELGPIGRNRHFDFHDLEYPITASVYFNARPDCWYRQSHCQTITEDNYRPEISLDQKIWDDMLNQFKTRHSKV